jgi:Tfp pilus assembly protein PilN
MHEVEFLPEWYPQVLRRRRWIFLQGWMVVVVAAALGLWLMLSHRNVSSALGVVITLEQQIEQTETDLAKLEELLVLQRQWRDQDRVVTRLGLHVEASRLLQALATLMPEEMSLLESNFEIVEDQNGALGSLVAARSQQQAHHPHRRLNMRVQGVAPTDMNLANFLARLGEVPFFERVAVTYVRDRAEGGHVMREFEVSFSISLATREGVSR